MSEKEQEQQKEIEELDSFHFEGPGFNDEVNEVTFPPTILEMIENSGKFTKEQIQYLDYLVDSNTQAREALRDMTMVYFEAVDTDSSNIANEQEKLTNNIKKTFFLEKKGGRKKRRKKKTRRKSKKRKRKTKTRRKKRKTKRGGAHRWGNYADFYNYLKKIDREKKNENASLGAQYTFRYKDSGLEKTETLAVKEAHEDGGTYYFIFITMINNDPEFIIEHNFDSSDILDGEEPYEEVEFKIPILPRAPEPGGGGRKKRRKTKKRRR